MFREHNQSWRQLLKSLLLIQQAHTQQEAIDSSPPKEESLGVRLLLVGPSISIPEFGQQTLKA